jgi:hypothetical protein
MATERDFALLATTVFAAGFRDLGDLSVFAERAFTRSSFDIPCQPAMPAARASSPNRFLEQAISLSRVIPRSSGACPRTGALWKIERETSLRIERSRTSVPGIQRPGEMTTTQPGYRTCQNQAGSSVLVLARRQGRENRQGIRGMPRSSAGTQTGGWEQQRTSDTAHRQVSQEHCFLPPDGIDLTRVTVRLSNIFSGKYRPGMNLRMAQTITDGTSTDFVKKIANCTLTFLLRITE